MVTKDSREPVDTPRETAATVHATARPATRRERTSEGPREPGPDYGEPMNPLG